MATKVFFLFYLYQSLSSSAWGASIDEGRVLPSRKCKQLSKSNLIDHHCAQLLHNNPFESCRRNSQQFKRSNDLVKLWSVVLDKNTKTLESDEPGRGMDKIPLLQKFFSFPVNEEAAGNIIQLVLFITVTCLMRFPSIASCTANALRIFPHRRQMFDYQPLSMMNWFVHYSTVIINYGIFHRLVRSSPRIRNAGTSSSRTSSNMAVPPSILNRKRKIYAIVNSGLGQIFGMTLMISHSLIGTRESMAQQVLYNFSHFLIQVSAMSLGPMLFFPFSLSCAVSSLIVYFNLTGYLTFTNLPGIILSNLSLLSVLVTPTEIFPRMFKIGHTMLSLAFIPVGIIDSKFGGETDLAHNLGAVWIATCTIILNLSLDNAKDNVAASE